jgi:hypothetical protein
MATPRPGMKTFEREADALISRRHAWRAEDRAAAAIAVAALLAWAARHRSTK